MFDLKCKTEIHNFFEVEIIRDNTVRKAYSQNTVLNNFFNGNYLEGRFLLWLGSGKGDIDLDINRPLEPINGGIFDYVSKKYEYAGENTYKLVLKYMIKPGELVGETIKEVGLRNTDDKLVTHSFLKDAEGNIINLSKTELDTLKITAIVYFKMAVQNGIKYSKHITPFIEDLRPYLLGYLSKDEFKNSLISFNTNREINFSNRVYKTRVGENECNKNIRYLLFREYGKPYPKMVIDIKNLDNFDGISLTRELLGTGDGTKTEFLLKYDNPKNITIYNGADVVPGNLYDIVKIDDYRVDYFDFIDVFLNDNFSRYSADDYFFSNTLKMIRLKPIYYLESTKTLLLELSVSDRTNIYMLVETENGLNIISKMSLCEKEIAVQQKGKIISLKLKNNVLQFKNENGDIYNVVDNNIIKAGKEFTTSVINTNIVENRFSGKDYYFDDGVLYKNFKKKKIIFKTPPSADTEILLDCTVDYIPKDENYIIDFDFRFNFSAGSSG